MNVLQDLVHYMEREIRRWQVVFGVLFLGKLCCNLPTVQVCHEVEGRRGGDRQHARHTPGTCHGGNIARLTSSARAWPIKGNPACLRQRQTLVNSRKQNNPTTS